MSESIRTLETLEQVGGALCLDFVNTVNARPIPEHDYLMQYSDVVDWAGKVGILSATESKRLRNRALEDREGAAEALRSARALRELIYRLFSAATRNSAPAKSDLDLFMTSCAQAIAEGKLEKKGDHYVTKWRFDEGFTAVLWPILDSARELLLSDALGRVKECPNCGWLFLDTSKNLSRRWCSMNTCGARDKMRRYHRRKRGE